MNELESMLREFSGEAATTRRVLDRVPTDKLAWRPHERSMSLGQLALHIAMVPAAIANITKPDTFDASQNRFIQPTPANMEEVHSAFEQTVRTVEQTLQRTTINDAHAEWRLMFGDKELQCMPRVSVWRSLMLNHWYHHRGQLAVYLRLLDVPVPPIYGPSADENPFAGEVTPAA
ncbi:MAG TPA: DinB family protein [Acidobacteriaceae bacterium]|nr:DinB family protein [Acidobacteriaceae bacterium]